MKNKDKFKDTIWEIACDGNVVAKVKGKLTPCNTTDCYECEFIGDYVNKVSCADKRKLWLNSEYTEPKQKLTKRERNFVDCIAADFHLVRECDGSIALFTGGFVLELDEGLFSFVTKMTSKKELLQMEVEK